MMNAMLMPFIRAASDMHYGALISGHVSTAGKAPASTASKPKSTKGAKVAKKTAKAAAPADGEKK